MSVGRLARRLAGALRREMFPTPESAALQQIERQAAAAPRRTAGRAVLLDLDLEYADAASTAPQWNDLFIRRTLDVVLPERSPRILDCGANIGLASLWLKRRFPHARMTAFEPDPSLCALLRRNLARNGAGDVEVIEAAVWTHDGEVAFRREGADSGAVDAVAADPPGDLASVRSVRLGPWLQAERVDLLKLDVEGAELAVLRDVEPLLCNVHALHVEVHDFDPTRRLLPDCLQLLQRAGFRYALDEFAVAHWRGGTARAGPFAHAYPAWVVLVRAWRGDAGPVS